MNDWIEDDRRHVWHPYTQMQTAPPPIPVVRGEGIYLFTADEQRILDGISSWWVNIHGHSHPRLNRALAEQAAKLEQVIFAGFAHEPAARLARALVDRAPEGLNRVFYSDDGSTAVEVALKMAYQAWRHRGETQRTLFVAFDDAYHGDTFGTMAMGGAPVFHETFRDLFFEVRHVATPVSRQRPEHSEELEDLLLREGERIAAVIIEPMLQGAGGMLVHPPEFLRQVRDLTKAYDIPLIADEIFTGFGRTGRFFACEHAAIRPDLMCVSKALTGGYLPLAATLTSEEIFEAFLSEDRQRTFFHGHSYTANPLACAVALESLALFEEENRLGRVAELETLFRQRLEGLASHPKVNTTRLLGPMAALEIANDDGDGYLAALGPHLYEAFLKRGILLRPLGNVLYFLPPYVIRDDEVHRVFDAIGEVLEDL
jgi:adenosylmethionine-8-amino-7-oxononanoate aminotransferase